MGLEVRWQGCQLWVRVALAPSANASPASASAPRARRATGHRPRGEFPRLLSKTSLLLSHFSPAALPSTFSLLHSHDQFLSPSPKTKVAVQCLLSNPESSIRVTSPISTQIVDSTHTPPPSQRDHHTQCWPLVRFWATSPGAVPPSAPWACDDAWLPSQTLLLTARCVLLVSNTGA